MADENVDERTALATQYADLSARIDALTAAKALVRDRLIDLGTGPAGALVVKVSQSRRLNPVRFATAYPPEDHPDYYRPAPIAAMAKALDDASVYDLDAPSVRVEAAK